MILNANKNDLNIYAQTIRTVLQELAMFFMICNTGDVKYDINGFEDNPDTYY